jgi:plasmid maintenance system antidote protein VapI
MTKSELADRIGKTPKTIGAIIKHGAPITPETAIELEKALGIPAGFWNNRELRYRESLAKKKDQKRLNDAVDWMKRFPVPDMIKKGWIQKFRDNSKQVNELLRFFGVASPLQWERIWCKPEAEYRISKAFTNNPEASSVWLRKGELEAQHILCNAFDRREFKKHLKRIRELTADKPETFQETAVHLCAKAGVAVLFIPPIKGSPVYGATRWLTQDKALIQLSLRGKFEDFLWFTFFHEAGHILLHGKKEVFIEDRNHQDEKEKEADRFARDFLIPDEDYRHFISGNEYKSKRGVKSFAAKLNISPAVVVGRLQHENLIPFNQMNDLRRRIDFNPNT